MVDGKNEYAMDLIYNTIDEAKEQIVKHQDGKERDYKDIWEIIDKKWDFQLHHELYVTQYFLHPHFLYVENISTHLEIKNGLYAFMKLINNIIEILNVNLQLDEFIENE